MAVMQYAQLTTVTAGTIRFSFATDWAVGQTISWIFSPAILPGSITDYQSLIDDPTYGSLTIYQRVITAGTLQIENFISAFIANGTYYVYTFNNDFDGTLILVNSVTKTTTPVTPTALAPATYYATSTLFDLPAFSLPANGDMVVFFEASDSTTTIVEGSIEELISDIGAGTTSASIIAYTQIGINGAEPEVATGPFAAPNNSIFVVAIGIPTFIAPVAPTTITVKYSVWVGAAFIAQYSKTFTNIGADAGYTMPRELAINLNRASVHPGPRNTLIVYNSNATQTTDALTLANYYIHPTRRNIPSDQVLALTAAATMTDTLTNAQALAVLAAIVAKIDLCTNPIKFICLVGDFPMQVPNWGTDLPMTLAQLLWNARFWLSNGNANANTHVCSPSLLNAFQGEGNYPAFSFGMSGPGFDPYITEPVTDTGGYVVYTLPLSPFADGLVIAQQRIDDCIEAEKAGYTDWGKVLLCEGSTANETVSSFVVEGRYHYDEKYPSNWQWSNVEATCPWLASHDPSGFASKQPGDVGFVSGLSDVFLASLGVNEYYNSPHHVVEQPGHYKYRRGAIRIAGQSYGFWPDAVDFIDTYAASPVISAMAPTAVYGAYDHPATVLAQSLRGVALPIFQLEWGAHNGLNAGATVEVSGSPKSIIGKVSGVTKWTVTTAGKTLETIKSDVSAAITTANGAGGSWIIDVGNSPGQMSRALAAYRAGCAIAAGVLNEPHGVGDVDCYGLFSVLWFGGSIGEWALRMMSGTAPSTPRPWAWMILGDIHYAPFRQSRIPGAARLLLTR